MAPKQKKKGRESSDQAPSSKSASRPLSDPDGFLRSLPESKIKLNVFEGPMSLSDDVKLTMQRLADPVEWKKYVPLLQTSIKNLRDLKLRQYAIFTLEARRDVTLSQSKIEVWRRVFEERYGLSGDPDSSAATFIEKAVEKLVPEDMENITRFIRFRQIFLMLYKEAKERKSPSHATQQSFYSYNQHKKASPVDSPVNPRNNPPTCTDSKGERDGEVVFSLIPLLL